MKFPSFINDLTLSPIEYHHTAQDWTKLMRAEEAVVFNEEYDSWVVFNYQDVVRVHSDYAIFSSQQTIKDRAKDTPEPTNLIEMDPPQHRQMRALLAQAFSPRTIAAREPHIQRIANELFDKALENDHFDWMESIANPLPIIVIADMLGLPQDNWKQLKAWTDAIINKSPEMESASQNAAAYFAQTIEAHYRQPQPDILSALIAAEVEGKRLSFEEVIAFCFLLFIAGNITTSNMLGNSILSFDEQPGALQQLRTHPELVENTVEEILRYMPPFRSGPNDLLVGRIATTDVTLGGKQIRKGDKVEVSRFSANFDTRQFTNPEQLDITRSPNRHQSFGHGIHFCIGAPLARLELKTVYNTLTARTQSIELKHDQKIEQVPSRLIFGPKELFVSVQV
jgi:cytochrome P450